MEPRNMLFLLLCAGEVAVVLAGQVSVPAAVILQLVIPLVLFREFLGTARVFLTFSAVFVLLTLLFAALVLSGRHTLAPLVVLAVLALFGLFAVTIARYRIARRYGGAA